MSFGQSLTAIAAFLIAFCTATALRPLLSRAGVIDIPNARSSHTAPVIRGGGLAQACAMVLVLVCAGIDATGRDQFILLTVATACLAAAILGWFEDLRGVRIAARAAAQLLIGVVAALAVSVNSHHGAWWAVLGGVALIGGINVVNFMDGVNGISAFHAILTGLTFVVVGHFDHIHWLMTVGTALAASFAAFLPFNLRGKMFLGDVGSYLLGGAIALTVTLGWMAGASVIALASPMIIYIADTGVTLVGRVIAKETWYDAHRDHTYQRFNRIGIGHLAVATIVATSSGACAVLGVTAAQSQGGLRIAATSGILILVATYTAIRFTLRLPEQQNAPEGTEI